MEEQKEREEYEELSRECRTEKESLKKRKTLERQLNKERKQRKGKKEGKGQNKWPKRVRENRGKSARQKHLDRTCGTQQIKHQLVINTLYTEHEVLYGYVFISSNRQKFKQGGN